ncbi:MAG: hypothetical protein ACK4L7_03915, partial [Flavobacteriales bacterium]
MKDLDTRALVLKAILPALLLCAGPRAAAQQKPFSSDQTLFLQEMTAFMVGADKKEGRPFMEGFFAPAWNGPYFNEGQRIKVAEVANFMLKKRFDAFPGFRDFLDCVAAFPATGRSGAEFDAWLQGLDKLVQGARKQNVQAFITTCAGLFREGALVKSASVTWKARSKDFAFAYDSVPRITFKKTDLICLAKGDSIVILGTSGTFLPASELWQGAGGKVTWQRAGLKPAATYAEWGHAYSVRMKSAAFEVDSV